MTQIWESLDGHRMGEHHRQMIRYSLAHLRFLEEQIADLDRAIGEKIEEAGLTKSFELLRTVPGLQ